MIQKQSFVGFLQNSAIFTGKHLCRSLFLIKLQIWRPTTLLIGDSNISIACEYYKNFKNSFFSEPLWWLRLLKCCKNKNSFGIKMFSWNQNKFVLNKTFSKHKAWSIHGDKKRKEDEVYLDFLWLCINM